MRTPSGRLSDNSADFHAGQKAEMGALPLADQHDTIVVRGARENNLRGIDLDIPKRRLTVFTGVSGSGKSSLVFDTIAAESQRLINSTYSSFIQGFMPTLARPDVDALEGLTPAIVVGQEPMGANPRSTVGTATDVDSMLRILFSRLATPSLGSPQAYSFNIPTVSGAGAITVMKDGREVKVAKRYSQTGGMCPRCEGRGSVSDIDLRAVVDESLSLNDGAILVPGYKAGGWAVRLYSDSGFFPADLPVATFSAKQKELFYHAEPRKVDIAGINMTFEGLIPKVRKSILAKDPEAMQPHIRAFVERAVTFTTCPECDGTRLNEGARNSRIGQVSIAEASSMQVSDLADWVAGLDAPEVAPLIAQLRHALESMVTIGLGYLSLNRPTGSLSGGEAQRIRMVRHLGSSLTDITYVFDEPTVGLHPHDIARMNELLGNLRDKGNTVLVVEHKPETIAIADHIVDLGPQAGSGGGQVTYQGDLAGLLTSDTLTGQHFGHRARLKPDEALREPTGAIHVRGASLNNLRNVDVDIPLGVLTVITGVAGSGKSSLIHGCLPADVEAITVDQSPIKGSRRSNPATYTGLLEPVRKAFAKANGVKPALFSANSEGACPNCSGAGVVYTELGFMETVSAPCEVCQGRRYDAAVLEYTLGGKNIADVLDMRVDEALAYFAEGEARIPAAAKIVAALEDVGLGYLSVGQPLTTLSGGERQRLKLAIHMAQKGGVYILDEPTTGLHLADVDRLLALLDRMVDRGATVIVVEHHQAVMAHADWLIDMGPGAGHEGGRVVFEGRPAQIVAQKNTLTGEHLAEYVSKE